tara:strand:- start:685 stop:1005 length:321 start_codon:yes stop_codon:yes gene_type:complete
MFSFSISVSGQVRLLCPLAPQREHLRLLDFGEFSASGHVRLLCPLSPQNEHLRHCVGDRISPRTRATRTSEGVGISFAGVKGESDKSTPIGALSWKGQVRLLWSLS